MDATPAQILLVGQAAVQLTPLLPPTWPRATASSIMEAILSSGGGDSRIIVVDAAKEADDLSAGIPSLRRVHPEARIVLLCEPMHEPLCRRAMAWGADDYEILPLEPRHARQILDGAAPRVLPALSSASAKPREDPPMPPHLPMALQRGLLDEMFEGRNPGDFAGRAAAGLAASWRLRGSLHFIPDGGESPAIFPIAPAGMQELRQKVHFAGQLPFGMLVWHSDTFAAPDTVLLEHAGGWLASLLAVARKIEQFRLMAITDELSGAYNLRYFRKKLAMDLKEAAENHSHVTLLYFDIDNFKKYNDTYGHTAGDAIIRELIKILNACTRPYDLVARIGGDEFAVVYKDNEARRQPNSTHPKDVVAATERFREAIRNHHWPETCKIQGTISISGGLATFPWHAATAEELLARADEALLAAKAQGKNVIVLTGHAPTQAEV